MNESTGAPINPIASNVKLGEGAGISESTNLYGCEIGVHTKVRPFAEVQKGSRVGGRVKVSSQSFICEAVAIKNELFIRHGAMSANDLFPRATDMDGSLKSDSDGSRLPTLVRRRAAIGSGEALLCGITIGEAVLVGAGSVVTRDVSTRSVVVGNPAGVVQALELVR